MLYIAEYKNNKLVSIFETGFLSERQVKDYIRSHRYGLKYSYIPNSCVKKITGSNNWYGTRLIK
jgi:hypothetical protein